MQIFTKIPNLVLTQKKHQGVICPNHCSVGCPWGSLKGGKSRESKFTCLDLLQFLPRRCLHPQRQLPRQSLPRSRLGVRRSCAWGWSWRCRPWTAEPAPWKTQTADVRKTPCQTNRGHCKAETKQISTASIRPTKSIHFSSQGFPFSLTLGYYPNPWFSLFQFFQPWL